MHLDALGPRRLTLLQADAGTRTADLARRHAVARATVTARRAGLERKRVFVGCTVRLGLDEGQRGVEACIGVNTAHRTRRWICFSRARVAWRR